MGAPLGNKNGRGLKGRSGRKSTYQERADAGMLWDMFLNETDKETVLAKIASGRYSLKDVWISKGLDGNDRVLAEIFKKLFPDTAKIDQKVEGVVSLRELFEGTKE